MVGSAPGIFVLDLIDEAQGVLTLSIVRAIVMLAAGIIYLVWLWRARRSAELIVPAGHHHGRGWTIRGWFCPIVNLWFPYRIVRDIWHASQPEGAVVRHTVVSLWWAAWLISSAVSLVQQWAFPDLVPTTSLRDFADAVADISTVSLVGTVVTVLCGAFAIRIVGRITRWQAVPQPSR